MGFKRQPRQDGPFGAQTSADRRPAGGRGLEADATWAHRSRATMRELIGAIRSMETPKLLLDAFSECVGRELAVDRSLIYEVDLEGELITGATEWLNPDVPGLSSTLDVYPLAFFRESVEWTSTHRRPIQSHARCPSDTLVADGSAEHLHGAMAIQSLLWFPFGFTPSGFQLLVFNQVTHERHWSQPELELVADAALLVEVALEKLEVLRQRVEALTRADAASARLRALVRNAPNAVLLETSDGRVAVTNRAFCGLFSLAGCPETLPDDSAVAIGEHFADPCAYRRLVVECRETQRAANAEEFNLTDGRVLEVDHVAIDDDEEGTGHLWIYRDVTRQRGDARRLRLLERAVEQSPVGVIITDKEARVDYVNDRFTEMSGYGLDEVRGKNMRFIRSSDTSAQAYEEMWSTIVDGRTWTGELTNRRKGGGDFTIRMSVCPILDEEGCVSHFVATHEDLTEQKRADAALQVADERMRVAERLDAASRVAGGVAHDFNNLLSIIKTYTGLAIEDLEEGDPVAEDLVEVLAATRRAADVTRRLLALTRRDDPRPRLVDINGSVIGLERVLRRLMREDVEVAFDLDPEAGTAWVDPGQLEQALLNLATNARDAMLQGGALTVTTRVTTSTGADPAPKGLEPGTYTLLRVQDTGSGLDDATRERIFDPFFTTKEVGRGTGLGLSLVQSFASNSQGGVTVASRVGQGATFTVWLPRQGASDDRVAAAPPSVALGAANNELVLVIDDEPELRELAGRALRRAGYRVRVAASGGEALLWCEQHGVTVDLLLCDVVMPVMHGPPLVERLEPLCPNAAVLFMSGYSDARVHSLPPDAALLPKPFDLHRLQGAVFARLEARGRPLG